VSASSEEVGPEAAETEPTPPEAATAEAATPETAASEAARTTPSKDPLHGVTLQMVLETLVERHGWEAMAKVLDIRCFTHDPSIKSSLTFLRRNPWARAKVEQMYLTNDMRPAWARRGKGRGRRGR